MARRPKGDFAPVTTGPELWSVVCCTKGFYEVQHVLNQLEPIQRQLLTKHPEEPDLKSPKALGALIWSFRQFMEDIFGREVALCSIHASSLR